MNAIEVILSNPQDDNTVDHIDEEDAVNDYFTNKDDSTVDHIDKEDALGPREDDTQLMKLVECVNLYKVCVKYVLMFTMCSSYLTHLWNLFCSTNFRTKVVGALS